MAASKKAAGRWRMSPNLENAYFLATASPSGHDRQRENSRKSARDAKRAIDAVEVVVCGGINVVPNHHHGHRAGGGSHPVRYQGGTVRQVSEVTPRA